MAPHDSVPEVRDLRSGILVRIYAWGMDITIRFLRSLNLDRNSMN
jgi:hypothetical protein